VVEGLRALVDARLPPGDRHQPARTCQGHFSRDAVERTNAELVAELARHAIPIARVAVCMHHPDGGPGGDPELVRACACSKPKPALLQLSMQVLGVAPGRTWMIGDSTSDVEAACAAGVRAALLFSDNRCELCPLRGTAGALPECHAAKLPALVRAILDLDRT
jgi:D-glycero-D-manno-heptose 1,7-bisphosphate phosphatase